MIPAPKPLPPLATSDPRSFYTIVVSGENFPVTVSAIQYDAPNFFTDSKDPLNDREYRAQKLHSSVDFAFF